VLILGVPAERIRALGETWDDGGLWDDILWLALLARAATDNSERRMRWHHLVMAVGNFKRQGGRRLRPSRISPADKFAYAARADHFNGPDDLMISRDDPDSWQHLKDSLAGAATATTTTLLAALWPDSHHILDWRVLAAAAGLSLVAGGDNGLDLVAPGGRDPLLPALDLYSTVRTVLIRQSARADVPLQATERALYLISKAINGQGMTWAEYGDELRKAAQADRAAGAAGTSDGKRDTPPAG
jgi:hypothetical protein